MEQEKKYKEALSKIRDLINTSRPPSIEFLGEIRAIAEDVLNQSKDA